MKFNKFLNTKVMSKLGGFKFSTAIDGKEELTPHVVMDRSIQAYTDIPFISSGVNQIVSFIIGGKGVWKSKDEESQKFANNFMHANSFLRKEIKNGALLSFIAGNNYSEPVYEGSKYKGFRTFPDPTRIYININAQNQNEYWILQVPETVREYGGIKVQRFLIQYIVGNYVWKYTVWGVPLPKKRFKHFKAGWSRDGLYGQGFLRSTINNNDIYADIMKNTGTVAKYRALNTKIFMPDNENVIFAEDDIDFMKENLTGLRDGDNVFLNRKVSQSSITSQGEYDTMSEELDFIRKSNSSGLTPNYLTPWSSDNARATASEARPAFKLLLDEWKTNLEEYFTNMLLEGMKRMKENLAPDLHFTFGNINLESWETLVQYNGDMYRDNVITLNEYRIAVGLESVKNGDLYYWQLQQQAQPQEVIDFTTTQSFGIGGTLKEAVFLPASEFQDQNVLDKLNNEPKWYHFTNQWGISQLPIGTLITPHLDYAKKSGYDYIYEVEKPASFMHTSKDGGKYHAITTSLARVIRTPISENLKEAIFIPASKEQDPKVVAKLHKIDTWYHATNKWGISQLPIGSLITPSLDFAKKTGYAYIYEVEKPQSFLHTVKDGKLYHAITTALLRAKLYNGIVDVNQDPEIINFLRRQKNFYYMTNEWGVTQVPVNSLLTYSLDFARASRYDYVYEVEKPAHFLHTTKTGNSKAKYHLITTSTLRVKKLPLE